MKLVHALREVNKTDAESRRKIASGLVYVNGKHVIMRTADCNEGDLIEIRTERRLFAKFTAKNPLK